MLTLEEIPLESLNLPKELLHAVQRNGIKTFGQLRKAEQDGDLLQLRFIGQKRSKEIKEIIQVVLAQPDKAVQQANDFEVNQTIDSEIGPSTD